MVDEIVKESRVIVHKERYAFLKTNEIDLKNHFMVSQDADEITVITEEANVASTLHEKEEKWFKLIEIKVSTPFTAGFIAKVTNIIASEGCNTLVVSTFSKDYILTGEEQIGIAVSALKKAGFSVESR